MGDPVQDLSLDGEKRIKAWEACARWVTALQRFVVYLDIAHRFTIGWGHLLTEIEIAKQFFVGGLTQDQSDALFRTDIQRYIDAVRQGLKVAVGQHAFDALCCLAYNIGTAGFLTSTALKLINAGATREQLEPWWLAWNKCVKNGVKVADPGLTNRRRSELELFFDPDAVHAPPDAAELERQKGLDLHPEEHLDDNDIAAIAAVKAKHQFDEEYGGRVIVDEDARDTIPAPAPLTDEPTSPQTPVSKSTPPSA